MNYNKCILTALTLVIISHCFAQDKNFGYRRKVNDIKKEGWYSITLPPDIFAHCEDDQRDIRLFELTGNDTLEVPYLLKKRTTQIKAKEIELDAINKSKKDDILFLTFELNPGEKINYINLQFEQTNYFAFVTIEGSDDKKQWYEIVDDQRIFSVDNSAGKYQFGVVNFAVTNHKYLRARVKSDKPLTFARALFSHLEISEGSFIDIPLTWTVTNQKNTHQTIVDITLDYYRPVSHLSVMIDNKIDFYRHCHVSMLSDSFETQKGWIKSYQSLNDEFLTSFKGNEFTFDNIQTRILRLTIDNQDNAPLVITDIKGKGPAIDLIANLKSQETFLFYGNRAMGFPSYNIAYFEEKIPNEVTPLSLGPEENIDHPKTQVAALFESKMWLWATMIILIAVLGYFTLKMMKSKPDVST